MGFRLALLAFVLVVIEGIARIAAFAGLCHIRTFPTADRAEDLRFLGVLSPHWGVWHVSNATVSVATPRGRITYHSNAHGMRDRPRAERSSASERVVVLGDSFVEGIHIEEPERATDRLEAATGVEFLNFGTSGGFGSIQEWQLYEHLARRFDHSRVCLFLLPDNDFADNVPATRPTDRYRPYLRKAGDTYEVAYPRPFGAPAPPIKPLSAGRRLRHHIYNRWYTVNLLVHVDVEKTALYKQRWARSTYDTYSPEDLDRLLFSYRQIIALAAPRPVYLFVIPRDSDFPAHRDGRSEGRLIAALQAFARDQPGLVVVDMLPYFLAYAEAHGVPYEKFFLGFDPHWSPLGHRVAADCVLEVLTKAGFKAPRADAAADHS